MNDELKWSDIENINITYEVNEAVDFILKDTNPYEAFPIDWQWITGTNNAVDEINNLIQNKRFIDKKNLQHFKARDMLEFEEIMSSINDASMPPDLINLQINDPVYIMRNLFIQDSIVKGTRATVIETSKSGLKLSILLKNNEIRDLPRIIFPG